MLRALNAIAHSDAPGSWVSTPGVISGCKVKIDSGLQVVVEPGKFTALNGWTAEIVTELASGVRVIPASGADRRDYIAAVIDSGGVVIQRFVDEDPTSNPLNQYPKLLKSGIMLAKLLVKYPTVGKDSIYVYQAVPITGEKTVPTVRPITIPDGSVTRFVFPYNIPADYSLGLTVGGVEQSEDGDYMRSHVTAPDGKTYTVVEFDEPPFPNADIRADIYLGKINI